jgi:hypothetical protein
MKRKDKLCFRERHPNLPLVIAVIALVVSIVKPILEKMI